MAPDEGPGITENLQTERLTDQFRSLEFILHRFDRTAFDRLPSNGKWSARQHLAHLARYHEIFQERLTRILEEECPRFDRYKAEGDAKWPEWESLSSDAVLSRLRQSRAELIGRLEQLPADAYLRAGVHPAFGPMTLTDWLEFFLVHEGHHMYEIFKNLHAE
ncbi:MAG: DinB family protein [Acidobacteriaceae bacterium]